MTKTQQIVKIIDERFRGAPFTSKELSKILKFHTGQYLDHLVRLKILYKGKDENGYNNIYKIGEKWNERNDILMNVPDRLGYLTDRVWDAIVHQREDFSISDIESYLRRENIDKSKIRTCLNSLLKVDAIEAVSWYKQERTYIKKAKERPLLNF
jgi:hypothetical protein